MYNSYNKTLGTLFCLVFLLTFVACQINPTLSAQDINSPRDVEPVENVMDTMEKSHADKPEKISSYEECVAAGYPVTRSLPPQCHTKDGMVFVDKNSMPRLPGVKGMGCKDLCGDGQCQEMVCMAIGCPCAETAESCPEDCD